MSWAQSFVVQDTQETQIHSPAAQPPATASAGLLYGLGAYLAWGFIPLYFHLLRHVRPVDFVAHRILWSVAFLLLVITAVRRWREVGGVYRSPRMLAWLGVTSVLIGINWLIFIWAVDHEQVLQASLGYFISPLINALLGMTFLKERLRAGQIASLLLATVAVGILTYSHGQLPAVALGLAVSFGFYGLLRKTVPAGPLVGLFVETALLTPLALAVVLLSSHTATMSASTHGMLALAGPMTALPLLMFAAAARRLRLTTLGFLQYLSPTCQFLLAVFVLGEAFTRVQGISFALIWLALLLYSIDSVRAFRARRRPEEVGETRSARLADQPPPPGSGGAAVPEGLARPS